MGSDQRTSESERVSERSATSATSSTSPGISAWALISEVTSDSLEILRDLENISRHLLLGTRVFSRHLQRGTGKRYKALQIVNICVITVIQHTG